MKTSLLLIFAVLSSCKCVKETPKSQENMASKEIQVNCPDDGVCKFKVLNNKTIEIKSYETGKIYYSLAESDTKSVVHFEYSRNVPEDLQDASYREEILFEIDNSTQTSTKLSDSSLKQTQMIFGKHCFCRGEAGYYNVYKGNLEYQYFNENLDFTLDFTIPEISNQVITRISTK